NNLIRPHVRSRTLNVDWYNHLAIEGTNHAFKRILIVHQNVIVRLTPLHFLKRTLLLTFFHTFINPQHFRLSQLLPFLHWRLLSADISVLIAFLTARMRCLSGSEFFIERMRVNASSKDSPTPASLRRSTALERFDSEDVPSFSSIRISNA